MCIFGGLDLETGFQNDIWCLEFGAGNQTEEIELAWRHLPVRSNEGKVTLEPPQRADHTAVFLEADATTTSEAVGALVVFGGRR